MTEGAGILCSFLADHETKITEHRVPVGYPVPGKRIWIASDDGNPVPTGVAGEIVVQSRVVSSGYLNRGEASLKRFRPSLRRPAETMLFTGDQGVLRLEDGALVWLGRRDVQVKVGGVRVSLAEVEAALLLNPGIKAAAVTVDLENNETPQGESGVLIAWYVTKDSVYLEPDQLRSALMKDLPVDAVPRRFIPLPSLPVLANGKVDRQSLNHRHPLATLRRCTLPMAPRTPIEAQVAHAFESALAHIGIVQVGAYDHFFELGGDSLAALNVLGILSTEIGRELPTNALLTNPTVASLAEMIVWSGALAEADRGMKEASPVVINLRNEGAQSPIFICPGGTGSENELLSFAKMLVSVDLDRPLYGVRLSAFAGEFSQMSSLSDLAARLVDAVLRFKPAGAWQLLGECGSALLAMEMVRIIKDGHPERMPERVILFDARTNKNFTRRGDPPYDNDDVMQDPQYGPYHRMLRNWEPAQFDFHIHLVTSEKVLASTDDPSLGWGELAKQKSLVMVHPTPGDHISYIRQYAQATGEILRDLLGGRRGLDLEDHDFPGTNPK